MQSKNHYNAWKRLYGGTMILNYKATELDYDVINEALEIAILEARLSIRHLTKAQSVRHNTPNQDELIDQARTRVASISRELDRLIERRNERVSE